jgi:outer membrane protein OmpA-like peptidoglycan-associated protein
MRYNRFIVILMIVSLAGSNCKNMNKTQKGAAIGGAGGAVIGGVIGKATGNTALGAIIGATVGGVTGAVIGRKMDKQAEEIKNEVPGAKVERVGEGIVVEFNNKILFGFDQSALGDQAKGSLNELITILNKYPETNIEIQGHTDNTGTGDYNQGLSERRAAAVATYLRNNNIKPSRITTKGFGESAPKYSNDTEDGRSQNRRVEFLITANEKMKEEAKKEAGN